MIGSQEGSEGVRSTCEECGSVEETCDQEDAGGTCLHGRLSDGDIHQHSMHDQL